MARLLRGRLSFTGESTSLVRRVSKCLWRAPLRRRRPRRWSTVRLQRQSGKEIDKNCLLIWLKSNSNWRPSWFKWNPIKFEFALWLNQGGVRVRLLPALVRRLSRLPGLASAAPGVLGGHRPGRGIPAKVLGRRHPHLSRGRSNSLQYSLVSTIVHIGLCVVWFRPLLALKNIRLPTQIEEDVSTNQVGC